MNQIKVILTQVMDLYIYSLTSSPLIYDFCISASVSASIFKFIKKNFINISNIKSN